MLGRLFGRGKSERDETVCTACGRTLLAGEWTQKVEGDDGTERLVCSLCVPARPGAGGERLKVSNGARGAVRIDTDATEPAAPLTGGAGSDEPSRAAGRGENDALWKAIKDRDAQIERLRQQLAHREAERQELLALLAQMRGTGTPEPPAGHDAAATGTPPGSRGATPTPAPDIDHAALGDTGELPMVKAPGEETAPAAAEKQGHETAAGAAAGTQVETAHTEAAGAQAEPALGVSATVSPAAGAAAVPAAGAQTAGGTHVTSPDETSGRDEGGATTAGIAEPSAEAGRAAALTVLQRGVDLLNVSPVPRKIAETNAALGIPSVHVGYEDDAVTVTFMWTMGWYRFTVAVDSGAIRLADRGYDERADLQPNASVRADGTVQLAAARISPAAAQRKRTPSTAFSAAETAADDGGAPSAVTPPAGGPEILSKSLLGQRTDDDQQSWEKTRAHDFDWDR